MQLKNIGIFALLVLIVVTATAIDGNFVSPANVKTLIRDTSLYGLISIGVAMVIITGGIDLSIGSMVALCGVMLVQVINVRYESSAERAAIVEVAAEPRGPFARPAVRLEDSPAGLRDGDRLVYRGTIGETSLHVARTLQVDEQTWVECRDSLHGLTAAAAAGAIPVDVQRIRYTPPLVACVAVLAFAAALGLIHGILVTRARLQPFVVTLCGLLIYRGLARVWTGDDQVGLMTALSEFKSRVTGAAFQIPAPLIGRISGRADDWTSVVWVDFPVTGILLAIVTILAWCFLNRTVWGRHLLATGENELAARYSGLPTRRLITLAYVISGLLAGLAGILFTLEWNSVQPGSTGNFYELYAIAAAVLGGCSLRGGRGAILGVIAGAAVMRCLYKAIVVLGIPQEWEMVIIGAALLSSVLLDESVRIYRSRVRRAL